MKPWQRTLQNFALFVAQSLLIVLAILTLLFVLQRLSGDPASTLAGHSASPEVLEAIREDMGLNEPLHIQYITFLRKALVLDFGESFRYQQPALSLVLQRFPDTLLLAASALGLAILIGIPLGVYATLFHRRADGIAINMLAGIMQALPNFWLGLILLLIFSVKLNWVSSVAHMEDNPLKRLALPAVTLSVFYIARLIRLVRSGLLEEMSQPYVNAARAKGLPFYRILFEHVFKNVFIPILAFVTVDLSLLLGGSVIVENVFSYSGMGEQMVTAIFNRDYSIVQATVFVIAVTVVALNSFSNVLYRTIDPRIQA